MQVNKSQAATIFGVSAVTINKWVDNGFPVTREEGKQAYKVDLHKAVKWYLTYKTKKLQEKLDAVLIEEDSDWEQEYKKYKAIRMKLEAHKEAGHLITIKEAQEAMLVRLIQIREALKQIPLSWPSRILGLENQQEAQEKLDELLQEILTQLSEQPDEIEYDTSGEEIQDIDVDDVDDVENIT